ncbi:hypothetical protein ACI2LF_05690 [Kribbella sp. NPDC020789]
MGEYAIKMCATGSPAEHERMAKDFYDRFDGLIAVRNDLYYVTVYTEAHRPRQAAMSILPALESIGLSVIRTDPDLVDMPEIALRLDVSRQAVHGWAQGNRRGCSFPDPLGSPGGKRIWAWFDIVDWALRKGQSELGDLTPGLLADDRAHIDAYLADRRDQVTSEGDWSIVGYSRASIRSDRTMNWPAAQYRYSSRSDLGIMKAG